MGHTLANPNRISPYLITVQDNKIVNAPIFISTEDHNFLLLLVRKVTFLGFATINTTDQDRHTFPQIILSSEHEWDPQSVHFPKASYSVEEEISSTFIAFKTQGEGFVVEQYDNDTDNQSLYDIVALS